MGDPVTIYYLPGMVGWSNTFDGIPVVLWNPLIQARDTNFGVRSNQFGFNIIGTNNFTVVVQACTNLANPVWTALQTLTLTNGSVYLRVEYNGAIYHVINRGDRREAIFLDGQDRRLFLETLGQTCQKTGWSVHAYCLMAICKNPAGVRPGCGWTDGWGSWGWRRIRLRRGGTWNGKWSGAGNGRPGKKTPPGSGCDEPGIGVRTLAGRSCWK